MSCSDFMLPRINRKESNFSIMMLRMVWYSKWILWYTVFINFKEVGLL